MISLLLRVTDKQAVRDVAGKREEDRDEISFFTQRYKPYALCESPNMDRKFAHTVNILIRNRPFTALVRIFDQQTDWKEI